MDKLTQAREALEWYAEKASAMNRYMTAKPPKDEAMVSVATELALDAGKRAAAILASLEPAAPEGHQPVVSAVELSGNTGELIDKMAEAIRGDTTSDDTPWATLSEDRKIGWRGDAERALAVVKKYLTARRPSEQAVTEAMAVCPECDGQKLMHGYDCDCPRCEATGVVPLGTAIRSILDDDDADVFEKLDDIRRAIGRKA